MTRRRRGTSETRTLGPRVAAATEVVDIVEYEEKTALIVVDVQNDFADPKGSLYVLDGEEIITVINQEIDAGLATGSPVVYTQDWHPDTTPHFEKDGGIWPVHCVMDTWGAEFHPRLQLAGSVIRKGSHGEDGYSGFTERDPVTGDEKATALEHTLRTSGIERTIVVGLATDYCVKATALNAIERGFDVTVLSEAVRAVNREPNDGADALREVEAAGGRVA